MTIPTEQDVDAAIKKQSASENNNKAVVDFTLLKTLLKNIVSSIGSAITGDVPVGGTTGQVLTKASNANLDANWEDAAGGEIDPDAIAALGVPKMRGPYTVLWSDTPNYGDTKALLTPAAGDLLIGIYARLVTPWEGNNAFSSPLMSLYDGDPNTGNSYDGNVALDAAPSNSANGAESMWALELKNDFSNQLPAYMGATPTPITAYTVMSGGPATAGRVDFYFLTVTPAL